MHTPASTTLLARLEADDLARNAANQRMFPRAPAGADASRSDLRVGPSSLGKHAGLGLFAGASHIAAKSRISQYRGALLPPDDLALQTSYTMSAGGFAVDGDPSLPVADGIAQRANDAGCMSAADFTTPVAELVAAYMRDARRCNVVTLSEGGGVLVLVAVRDIAPHDELFHFYGAEYWLGKLRAAAAATGRHERCAEIDAARADYLRTVEGGRPQRAPPADGAARGRVLSTDAVGIVKYEFAGQGSCWIWREQLRGLLETQRTS